MDHKADPDRHSFLHTAECNILWKRFVNCKNEHYILRYFDYCSDDYTNVLKCFKQERRQKAANNHKLAMKAVKKHVDDLVEQKQAAGN